MSHLNNTDGQSAHERSTRSTEAQQELDNELLRRLIPGVERRLTEMARRQEESFRELFVQLKEINTKLDSMAPQGASLQVSINGPGRNPLQLNIGWPEGSHAPAPTQLISNSNIPNPNAPNMSTPTDPVVPVTQAPIPTTNTPSDLVTTTICSERNTSPVRSPVPNFVRPLPTLDHHPVRYKLSRTVRSLRDLYKEWTIGLDGKPAIEYLNIHHKGWNDGDRTFYRRR
ncbi:hypothetical protein CU098_005830, partial [Rhizopus stolonifer]